MSFTLSTVPLLALSAFLWYRAKGKLLPVVMFMSVFQAASILNLSANQVGVQPSYFLLLLALAQKIVFWSRRRKNFGGRPNYVSVLLGLFVAYCAVTAFTNPWLFRGVLILNPRVGFNVPLEWETSHLNQLFYLLLSFSLYVVAAYKTSASEIGRSLEWFVGGCLLASLIGIYQYLCVKTGLPFPTDYLHTNPTYAIFEGYEINGFPRMNSTFTEASSAAFALIVALALASWPIVSGSISVRGLIKTGLLLIGLMITVSTTGYVCLAYLLAISSLVYFFRWKGNSQARAAKVLLTVPVFLLFITLLSTSGLRESVGALLHTVILDKQQTDSYRVRTQMNEDALTVAAHTDWAGAGWGVCRASSLIPTMLANVGLPGFLLFFWVCFKALRPMGRLLQIREPMHAAVLLALSAALLDLAVSGPDPSHPILWLLLAIAAKYEVRKAPSIAERGMRTPKYKITGEHVLPGACSHY